MKPQLFIHRTTPNPELILPVENNIHRANTKPESGGMWTSTLNDNIGSSFLEFATEQLQTDRLKGVDTYVLIPKEDIEIYTIDSLDDLKKLPFIENIKYNKLDFVKISGMYDGIHLTEKGEMSTRSMFQDYNL